MTDEQLLDLALQQESLTPFARSAFEAELAGRHLGPSQIAEHREDLRRFQIEREQRKLLARSFHGFGTNLYGKRDFDRDGSFLTTKWVIFFWIPVIPLKSLRVKSIGFSGTRILFGRIRKYLVLQVLPVDVRQVLSIYGYVGSLFLVTWIFDMVKAGALGSWIALVVWGCLPWLLRIRARQLAHHTESAPRP